MVDEVTRLGLYETMRLLYIVNVNDYSCLHIFIVLSELLLVIHCLLAVPSSLG
jgi:hypothetical protein